jgi:hypothetical protein
LVQLLRLADTLGPYLCILKTHVDIIEDFDADLVHMLPFMQGGPFDVMWLLNVVWCHHMCVVGSIASIIEETWILNL